MDTFGHNNSAIMVIQSRRYEHIGELIGNPLGRYICVVKERGAEEDTPIYRGMYSLPRVNAS